jgi:alpha-ketoglutarate-dependent taurine dioxygenase
MVRFQRGVVARGFELSSKKPTEKQHQLIKVFLEEIMKYEIRIPLATGEILTFDNHRVPHARTRGSILLKETTIVGREFLTGFVQGLRKD